MTQGPQSPLIVAGTHTRDPVVVSLTSGACVAFTTPGPDRAPDDPNQDSAAVVPVDDGVVLIVADGLGGIAGGTQASSNAVEVLAQSVQGRSGDAIREAILDGFERADEILVPTPGQTTLIVAEVRDTRVRIYNVGDSTAMQVGGGGKIKHETVAHSPVGYLVAAGMLDQSEALHHDALHLISNTVGADQMRIDIGPSFELAPRDTLIVGTDGLFDNLHREEIAEAIRKGPLAEAAAALAKAALERMSQPRDGEPSKPDDLTFVLYRPAPRS
jgi:PPM family protein phosphatase